MLDAAGATASARRTLAILSCSLLAALVIAGCAKRPVPPPVPAPGKPGPATQRPYSVEGRTYRPIPTAKGFTETGDASWYGPGFDGKRTSNGELYDMNQMTAAHKILPMNTWVKVVNLKNGKTAVVRINDRGPFVDGRVIDLSRAAARKLDMIGGGTAPVRITALGYREPGTGVAGHPARYLKPGSFEQGPFSVQVGAFLSESNAWRLAATLRARHGKVLVVAYDRGDAVFHRVRVGKLDKLKQARALQAKLRAEGFKDAFAVAW